MGFAPSTRFVLCSNNFSIYYSFLKFYISFICDVLEGERFGIVLCRVAHYEHRCQFELKLLRHKNKLTEHLHL
jgi:hypothetical protein